MKNHLKNTGFTFITRQFGPVEVWVGHYMKADGPLAIQLVGAAGSRFAGEPIAKLSYNPEFEVSLNDNEFYMKTWSENVLIAEDADNSGLFGYAGHDKYMNKIRFLKHPDCKCEFGNEGFVLCEACEYGFEAARGDFGPEEQARVKALEFWQSPVPKEAN